MDFPCEPPICHIIDDAASTVTAAEMGAVRVTMRYASGQVFAEGVFDARHADSVGWRPSGSGRLFHSNGAVLQEGTGEFERRWYLSDGRLLGSVRPEGSWFIWTIGEGIPAPTCPRALSVSGPSWTGVRGSELYSELEISFEVQCTEADFHGGVTWELYGDGAIRCKRSSRHGSGPGPISGARECWYPGGARALRETWGPSVGDETSNERSCWTQDGANLNCDRLSLSERVIVNQVPRRSAPP